MPAIHLETSGARLASKAILSGLKAYNRPHLGRRKAEKKLVFTARDEAGVLIGGIVGYFSADWLYVHLLWVDPAHRGQDIGTALIREAEAETRRRGGSMIRLETWSFQAPGFYPKLGFKEFGRIDGHPIGHATIFFAKLLT